MLNDIHDRGYIISEEVDQYLKELGYEVGRTVYQKESAPEGLVQVYRIGRKRNPDGWLHLYFGPERARLWHEGPAEALMGNYEERYGAISTSEQVNAVADLLIDTDPNKLTPLKTNSSS